MPEKHLNIGSLEWSRKLARFLSKNMNISKNFEFFVFFEFFEFFEFFSFFRFFLVF